MTCRLHLRASSEVDTSAVASEMLEVARNQERNPTTVRWRMSLFANQSNDR